MESNPYESPQGRADAIDSDLPFQEQAPLLTFLFVSLVTSIVSTVFAPLLCITAALLITPAMVRTEKILRVRFAQGLKTNSIKLLGVLARSLMAAIPVAVASAMTLCCIGSVVIIPLGSNVPTIMEPRIRVMVVGVVLIAMFVSLCVGHVLLRRWKYLSIEVRRFYHAHQRTLADESSPSADPT